ncbi:MAG: hypothetical protein J5742_02980 [Alphaproteobacteria bacterium]|nr:hypothetical protein [Alphaproteobacteria bacterium]
MMSWITYRLYCLFCIGICLPIISRADENTLIYGLQNTYSACIGIDDALSDLKKMAGINTAITGIGTGLGVGATVVGVVKSKRDQEIDEIVSELDSMGAIEIKSESQLYDVLAAAFDETGLPQGHDMAKALRQEKERKEQQSKKLGNWRTGLLAGNTATNIAGAIIASKNRADGDLQNQINNCKNAVTELRRIKAQARLDGIDTSEADKIISACDGFETADITKINQRAKGAMVSSIVGATTGITGTITSAAANSDNVRSQKDEKGGRTDKEKNLNTTSNVLAGTSTVASATATVFNATQIKAIKDIATIATQCTEALK